MCLEEQYYDLIFFGIDAMIILIKFSNKGM
jgi:hypothetical protein